MVVRRGRVQRDARADRDLVPDDEERQQLAAGDRPLRRVDEREQPGKHRGTGVALREDMPVVGVDAVDRHPTGERRTGRAGTSTVEEDARAEGAAGPGPNCSTA